MYENLEEKKTISMNMNKDLAEMKTKGNITDILL